MQCKIFKWANNGDSSWNAICIIIVSHAIN